MRKISFALFLIFFSVGGAFAQSRKGALQLSPSMTHHLYVAFDSEIAFQEGDFTLQANEKIAGFREINEICNMQLQKGIQISDAKLLQMEQAAETLSGNSESVKRLRNIFKITVDNPTNARLLQLASELEKLEGVVYSSLLSAEPIQPPADIVPVTSDFQPSQTYIGANPGVNMQYAWDNFQTGTGIRLRDVEYGFNKSHEEFADIDAFMAPGMTINTSATIDYTEHGTAVFGIAYADKGIYGVSGLAHGADEMIFFPEWQQIGYDRVFAVSEAVANSLAGDVIIYEMQTFGQGNQYVMAEFDGPIWDLTKAATDAGIVVVAAAGNGNQNLDSAYYTTYMGWGDSGAIIVGAGTSNVLHNKLSYSTYGTRVDVQAWGENVYTTGYYAPGSGINSFQIGNDFNQSYSTNFAGTSSATPIVASCAAVLQSYFHGLTNQYMTSQQIRTVLKNTGVAQGNVVLGNIGPIPNMQAAMQAVYANYLLDNKDFKTLSFQVYPNPTSDKITIASNGILSTNAVVEVFNGVGQCVYAAPFYSDKIVNLSRFPEGFYMIRVSDNGISATKKIIRR